MRRLETLDLVRGMLFLNMAAYHWQYITGFLWGSGVSLTEAERVWQFFICGPFILLAGFSAGLTKRRLQHGVRVLSAALVITIGSLLLMPDQTVWFGILTFMALGYVSVYLLDDLVKKLPQLPLLVGLIVLFALCYPDRFGQSHAADYFAFVPWIFLFWSGRTAQRLWYDKLKDNKLLHINLKPINFLGRHTLLGYLLHLPVLAGVAYGMLLLGWV